MQNAKFQKMLLVSAGVCQCVCECPKGVPSSDRWWLVLRQTPSCPHLSPLPPLVVLLSHNYNSIVIQFLGRQINRISFLVTRHAPRPVAAHSPSWGEVRHGGCGRVGCTCSSSDWCLCQLFWCQINKLLTVGRQAGGGQPGRGSRPAAAPGNAN